jgi:hypothetical protein
MQPPNAPQTDMRQPRLDDLPYSLRDVMVLRESEAVELRLGQIGVVWREGVERVVLP